MNVILYAALVYLYVELCVYTNNQMEALSVFPETQYGFPVVLRALRLTQLTGTWDGFKALNRWI